MNHPVGAQTDVRKMKIKKLIAVCGLLLIGVRYAILLAALLTLFDLLPVFGLGCALVPWGLFEIAAGTSGRGFALLLLFLFL